MKKRIFIAINLPDTLKKKLIEFQKNRADLPFRWTSGPNLHITLIFIGYVTDEQLFKICKIARQALEKQRSFEIKLNHICYGPPGKPARMVWVEAEATAELAKLKDLLEDSLLQSTDSDYGPASAPQVFKPVLPAGKKEIRPLRPHITLGRLKLGHKASELPLFDEKVDYRFYVESIEIMESNLRRGGAEYSILESISLK